MAPKLLFVDNRVEYFISHRLRLALGAQAAGFEVHVSTLTGGDATALQEAGLTYHSVTSLRRDSNPFNELKVLVNLHRLYRSLQPDLAHHITLRAVLYGGGIARQTRVPAVVSSITGLGYVFTADTLRAALLRKAVLGLMPYALRQERGQVTFQNPDDEALFVKAGVLGKGVAQIIKGSGVDTHVFMPRPEPDGAPIVLFPARMLWHKGVGEFVDAARILRQQKVEARFVLAGDADPENPATVPLDELERWREEGIVEWWGHQTNMPQMFAQAHLVCLPSYREGVPKVLIEAAACGRAIVTTDVPGCREIVRHKENGLLVPPQQSESLATALSALITNPEERKRMGKRGRDLVEQEFGIEKVVEDTVKIYKRLPTRAPARLLLSSSSV